MSPIQLSVLSLYTFFFSFWSSFDILIVYCFFAPRPKLPLVPLLSRSTWCCCLMSVGRRLPCCWTGQTCLSFPKFSSCLPVCCQLQLLSALASLVICCSSPVACWSSHFPVITARVILCSLPVYQIALVCSGLACFPYHVALTHFQMPVGNQPSFDVVRLLPHVSLQLSV